MMNQSAYSQMISCFISILCHISNSYRWLHVARRIPLNLVRACQLINCTDYQFVNAEILVRTKCADRRPSAEVVLSKEKHLFRGLSFANRGIMGKAGGYRPILFKDRGSQI